MNKRTLAASAVLVTGLLSTAACAPGSQSKDDDPLVIGISASMTGPASAFGKQEGEAAKILFDEINADGGIDGQQVKVILLDNASTPEQAALNAKAFIAEGADVIMAGATQTTMRAVEPFAKDTLVVNFGSGYVPPADSNIFCVVPYDDASAATTLDWFRSQNLKNIGLLASTDTTGETAVDSVNNAMESPEGEGLELVRTERFDPTSPDVTPQLTQLRANDAEGVIAWVSGSPAAVVAKSYSQLGVKAPLVVSWANGSFKFAESTASFSPDELFVPVPRALLPEDPANAKYVELVKPLTAALKAKGERLDLGGTLVYDSVQMVLRALEGGDSLEERVSAIEEVRDYEGIWGTYNFSETDHKGGGHAGNPAITMAQVIDGTLKPAP